MILMRTMTTAAMICDEDRIFYLSVELPTPIPMMKSQEEVY
jgi:hypothetical protein